MGIADEPAKHAAPSKIPGASEGQASVDVQRIATALSWGSEWLAPTACLMHSHLPPPEQDNPMVQVVGIADCQHLAGYVLTLD
jgi:hypothetical protein